MKKMYIFMILSFLGVALFAQDQHAVVGWAAYGGTVTGGGDKTPVIVKTASDLSNNLKSNNVVYIDGTISISSQIQKSGVSNLTVIGLPGSKLVSTSAGILLFKGGCKNIIIQNVYFQGPGSADVNGSDNLAIRESERFWVDHCTFVDGQDGNFDITNAANYVSVTWCKFLYTATSSAHNLTNLIAGSDSDNGEYKITFQYCYWGERCVERMPRVRFGQVHVANCYFNTNGSGKCGVTAGYAANCRVEKNYFERIDDPIDLSKMAGGAVIQSIDNYFASTVTGNKSGSGTAFTPPYTLTMSDKMGVKDLVTNATCGAGQIDFSKCGGGGGTTYTLSTNTSGSGTVTVNPSGGTYSDGAVVTLTATPNSGYTFSSWSGDASGSTNPTTVTMSANKSVTATFTASSTYYTLSTSVTGNGSITMNPSGGSYLTGSVVNLTAVPSSGYVLQSWSGDASGYSNPVTVTMTSNKSVSATFVAASSIISTAYVTDPLGGTYTNDTKILPALKADCNFLVTEVDGSKSGNNYSNYDLVILSEVPNSAALGIPELEGISKPFLMMKVHAYKSTVWNWDATDGGFGQNDVETNISVTNSSHAIFNGVTINSNEVQMLSSVVALKGLTYANTGLFSVSGGSISQIATVKNQAAQKCIFEIPAGTTVGGTSISQKWMQIGINSTSYANVTDDAVKIIKNACFYLTGVTPSVCGGTGIENKIDFNFYCSPTIVTNNTTLSFTLNEPKTVNISIIDISGKKVFEMQDKYYGQSEQILNLSGLNKGMYICILKVDDSVNYTKIIKN